ncbi:hypothetical protein DENSPDRAFT_804510 [Dentipellis sp. KUC8613]|nr:hypothetical protein DENSPDRAFT_804510 [Dentipellis sp. KUC8613]
MLFTMSNPRTELLFLCMLSLQAVAQDSTEDNSTLSSPTLSGYASDPILRYRPNFGRSLPTQILVTGIILTLVSVLLIHLLFTAQYHWKLAQCNYILQMSAVLTLLTSLIASLKLVLDNAVEESQHWPFMLDYIAVDLPPLMRGDGGWSQAGLAAWLLMNATTSALIQITHIQFLTLMYPSRLEARLIFALLGPLAIVAAVMQMIPIQSSTSVISIANAIRNVCNATLSLLFTSSLLIWGTVVNRRQAWRTDGGTAAFGVGALALAVISTALTFIYIPSKEQYDWMPPLTWAVMLWQSFLGWWWWVGSGMGVGEVEELLKREEKRRRRRRVREERRREQKEKARVLWKGMTDKFHTRPRRASAEDSSHEHEEHFEDVSVSEQNSALSVSVSASPSSTGAGADVPQTLWRRVASSSYTYLQRGFLYLRQAHLMAARMRAEERVERINEAYANEGAHDVPDRTPRAHGWGLGSFGVRERELERRRSTIGSERDTDEESAKREDEVVVGSSMWWRGPLRRWRLQDSTVYS